MNGWIVLDKDLGISSTLLGNKLKRILKAKKIGHIGTLDPLASGVLVFAVGEATKLIPYLNWVSKTYVFDITFGERRETGDAEGEVCATSKVIPSYSDIESVLTSFVGFMSQVPPAFSAVHINGKRAYELARRGEKFFLPKRNVEIKSIELLSYSGNTATIKTSCGKGTYIRSLASDIATKLDSVCYVSRLRRIADGPFEEKDSIQFANILQLPHKVPFLDAAAVLNDILVVAVSKIEAQDLLKGKCIYIAGEDGLIGIKTSDQFLGIAVLKNNLAYPKRMFITN